MSNAVEIANEYVQASKAIKKLVCDNSVMMYKYYDFHREYIDSSLYDYAIFSYFIGVEDNCLKFGDGCDTIKIPLEFFNEPQAFVKGFEARCIFNQEQNDIEEEQKDKEKRRKQFYELKKEFENEV